MRAKSPEYVSGPAMKPQTQSGSQAVTATGFDPVIGGSNPPPAAKFTAVPCDAGITITLKMVRCQPNSLPASTRNGVPIQKAKDKVPFGGRGEKRRHVEWRTPKGRKVSC